MEGISDRLSKHARAVLGMAQVLRVARRPQGVYRGKRSCRRAQDEREADPGGSVAHPSSVTCFSEQERIITTLHEVS